MRTLAHRPVAGFRDYGVRSSSELSRFSALLEVPFNCAPKPELTPFALLAVNKAMGRSSPSRGSFLNTCFELVAPSRISEDAATHNTLDKLLRTNSITRLGKGGAATLLASIAASVSLAVCWPVAHLPAAATALVVVASAASAGWRAAGSWSKHVKNLVTLLAAGEEQILQNMAPAHRDLTRHW